MDDDHRLPTAVWVEAALKRLTMKGMSYYVVQKGAYAGGTVLVKISIPGSGACRLLTQQRNLDGKLGWSDAMSEEKPADSKADDYIRRAVARDPDVWVIEVEDKEGVNPFDDNRN